MKVLYVLGFARSGTTLLGNLLGECDACFHVGEAWYLWERLLHGKARDGSTALCGCGAPLRHCPLWRLATAVVQRSPWWPADHDTAPSGVLGEDTGVAALHAVVDWQRGTRGRAGNHFPELSGDLYRAIGTVAGAEVIVDSSKLARAANLLLQVPGVTPYFVHILRDPRGVLFSRQRRRMAMRRRPNWPLMGLDAYRWLRENQRAQSICALAGGGRSLSVRYEEFAAEPASVLRRVLDMVEIVSAPMSFLDGNTAQLGVNHTVRGNRNRFTRGEVVIREDREWTTAFSKLDRLMAGALTAPLRRRYGYHPVAA